MANIPGAVTDPPRVKDEEIHFKCSGDSIPGCLTRPGQPGSYPGIVVIHEAFGLGRPHPRHRSPLRQYRLQRSGTRPLRPCRWPQGPKRHQHGVAGHVWPACQEGGAGPRSRRGTPARACPAPPRRSARSASVRAAGTRCYLPAAARSMPRSIAGAASSTAPPQMPPPRRRDRRRSSISSIACTALCSRICSSPVRRSIWGRFGAELTIHKEMIDAVTGNSIQASGAPASRLQPTEPRREGRVDPNAVAAA